MPVPRRVDTDAYVAATECARGVRAGVAGELRDWVVATVADQLGDLTVEADRMGGRTEFAKKIERILFCERRLVEALGRQKQARVEGMPLGRAIEDEHEFRSLLREAVMGCAVACAGWVAAMDFEQLRQEQGDV